MKLTSWNKQNKREVEMMFRTAVCAYANWKSLEDYKNLDKDLYTEYVSRRAEYEATVRCIDVFVQERLHQVYYAVIDEASKEFGI